MRYLLLLLFTVIGYVSKAQQEIELCPGTKSSFTYWANASTAGGGWIWMLNGDTISQSSNVRIDWRDTGFYVIRVVYKDDCGKPSRTYRVVVKQCPESSIFFPNAFTPNSDNLNDGWSPIPFEIKAIRWQIYNRWGQRVFESNQVGQQWDGTYLGAAQPIGGYVFQCWWRGKDDKTGYRKGSLILIR